MRIAFHLAMTVGLVMPSAWAQVRSVNAEAPAASGSYLGIWIWEVDAVRAKELRLPTPGGIEVTLVRQGSPADIAGLKAGDVVAEYNGMKVESIEQFSRMVRETPSGKPVRLRIFRNGSPQILTAKIDTISPADRPGPIPAGRLPQTGLQDVPRSLMTWRNPLLGIDAEPLFGQLAEYFGVAEGVLVRSVAAGSPADNAGMRAGDVITRVGKQGVTTPAEITSRLRALSASGPAAILVMRERKEVRLLVSPE
ncbi:MAG: PDZ domain-containing protein [Bryobacteraceae bacterium]